MKRELFSGTFECLDAKSESYIVAGTDDGEIVVNLSLFGENSDIDTIDILSWVLPRSEADAIGIPERGKRYSVCVTVEDIE